MDVEKLNSPGSRIELAPMAGDVQIGTGEPAVKPVGDAVGFDMRAWMRRSTGHGADS